MIKENRSNETQNIFIASSIQEKSAVQATLLAPLYLVILTRSTATLFYTSVNEPLLSLNGSTLRFLGAEEDRKASILDLHLLRSPLFSSKHFCSASAPSSDNFFFVPSVSPPPSPFSLSIKPDSFMTTLLPY
ncbi:hypothetical protein OIU84_012673 [Salix udensis]|uniref:Uncharacterized protein n=1 Tax=Salix udensis TaxID=889485 RepID=A0AAD6NTX5_9ROSI|nr:hypothetical protein OIU84_012673 [Salix udensis]